MIGHKLPNKTKNATVAEPKLFHQLNNPFIYNPHRLHPYGLASASKVKEA
jgi:hypothetical protein